MAINERTKNLYDHLAVVRNATVTSLAIALGVPPKLIRESVRNNPELFIAHTNMYSYIVRVELRNRGANVEGIREEGTE